MTTKSGLCKESKGLSLTWTIKQCILRKLKGKTASLSQERRNI